MTSQILPPTISRGGGVELKTIPPELRKKFIIDARWTMYKNFLDEHSGEYSQVFVTDIRDVIFQGDLFEKYSSRENFLVCALETTTFKNNLTNVIWMKKFFGEEEYRKLEEKPVICAGTVHGSPDEMIILLEKLGEIMGRQNSVWGIDQAALNYLVHNKLLLVKNFIGSDVTSGEIFTVADMKKFELQGENILRGDGKVPAVVHQYDRHQQMVDLADKIYREKNFQFDEKFSDPLSIMDQVFYLVHLRRWTDATKIFVKHFCGNPEVKIFGEKLLKLFELILKKFEPNNFDGETLLVQVQGAIAEAFSGGVTYQNLEKIYFFFDAVRKNNLTVSAKLKFFIVNLLVNFSNIFYQNGNKESCPRYFERLEELNLPLGKDFYMFESKVFHELGDKKKSLAAYEKFLDSN